MNKASTGSSKDRWNASHYSQVKIYTKPETAAAFKAACSAADVSIASVLSKFMDVYIQKGPAAVQSDTGGTSTEKPRLCRTCYKVNLDASAFSTRRKRRAAIKAIISQMEQIALAEEKNIANIPENFQDSEIYENAEQSFALLEEAIELLGDIY